MERHLPCLAHDGFRVLSWRVFVAGATTAYRKFLFVLNPEQAIVGPSGHHFLLDHLRAKLTEKHVEKQAAGLGHHDSQVD